jgi:MFS family permease
MIRAAFATPGFKRLYGGLAASMLGDSLMLIVLSLWVKTLTGSNGAAGLTFLWLALPALMAPVFGYVVDRFPRKPFLVVANVASAAAVLPLLLVRDAGDVWIIYAVAFLYGVSFVVIPAALNGLLKDLLAEDVLVDANASLAVTREALRLVGPLAGASLFAYAGGAAVVALDAMSFVVAAVAVAVITVEQVHDDHVPSHWRVEFVAGISYLRTNPRLLHSTLSLGLCLLVVGFSESAVYAVLDAFGKPAEFVGPVLALQGVGAVGGGLVAGRVVRRLGEPLAIVAGLSVMAVGLLGVAAAVAVWQLLAVVAVVGAGLPLLLVAYTTLLQRETPSRLMGRVSTATDVLITTPQALSIAVGALLVGLLDYRLIFVLMAVGVAAAATYLLLVLRRPASGRPDLAPVNIPWETSTPHGM